MKKIIIPIDGSENSKRALLEGKKLANLFESEVFVLYVRNDTKLPGAYADVTSLDLIEEDEETGKKIIDNGLEVFKDYTGVVKSDVENGDPAEVIINAAERENADLIVMGSRGLSGVKRFILGSVSNKVLNHSETSVLVIR